VFKFLLAIKTAVGFAAGGFVVSTGVFCVGWVEAIAETHLESKRCDGFHVVLPILPR
jgi:hypothetical protein